MANNAKYAVVKQSMGVDRKVVGIWEYEVRKDAYNERDRHKSSKKFYWYVLPLRVGRIARSLQPKK